MSMKLTRDQVKTLAAAVSLEIPEEDLDNVTIRVTALLEEMERIEAELGEQMDRVEPVPPVFPREET
jgi:Asp-tRNA(Asn)/Glu-tRNA(Gln) amidotransferase C subunit